LVDLQGTKGQPDKELGAMVEKLNSIGFDAVGKNEHIETHYYNKYKQKNLDLLNFYPVVDKESLRELILSNPDFGAYTPFNFLVYKTLDSKNDDNTWFGHLSASTMLDIIGEKDKETRTKFTAMVAKLDTLAHSELKPTQSKKLERVKALPTQGITKMVKKFKKPEDMETFVEDFIADHDMRFSKHHFIISGFIDLAFEYDDLDLAFDKYDAYKYGFLMAKARVSAAKAKLRLSEINLGYTKVRATISGYTGLKLIDVGNLVKPGTPLVKITQVNPIYAEFSVPDVDYLNKIKYLLQIKIHLILNGKEYKNEGKLDFKDVNIDEGTSTVKLRAIFTNKKRELMPGEFVRVKISGILAHSIIKIPQKALLQNALAKIVYVVKNGRVTVVPVKIVETVGNYFIVKGRLKQNDLVIIDNFFKIRPGMLVKVDKIIE